MSRPASRSADTLFTVGVACAMAIGVISAKLAYLGGASVMAVVSLRTVAAFAGLAGLLAWQGVALAMPPRQRAGALALGLLLCVQTFGLLAAVNYMSPPLAVLVYDTYPMLTAIGLAVTGQERLTRRKTAAFLVSFCGLILVLNTGELRPSLAGITSSLAAALAFAALLVLAARWFPPGDSRPRTVHMTASASAVFLVACAFSGSFTLPDTPGGWLGIAGLCIVFPLGLTGVFVSVGRIGPARTGMLMNFEPVAVAAMSALLFGDVLTGPQLLGGAMVVGAILLLQSAPAATT